MKRLVTTANEQGKATVLSAGRVPHYFQAEGFEMGSIWATAGPVTVGQPAIDTTEGKPGTVPGVGESHCLYCIFPPAGADSESQPQVADERFNLESGSMMHTTDTVDYGVILQGELWLELDDGEQHLLTAGDSFVQNGTRHEWHNRGDQPAVMFVVMLGAARQ